MTWLEAEIKKRDEEITRLRQDLQRAQREVERLTDELEGIQAEALGACNQHHATIEKLEARCARLWDAYDILEQCHHGDEQMCGCRQKAAALAKGQHE